MLPFHSIPFFTNHSPVISKSAFWTSWSISFSVRGSLVTLHRGWMERPYLLIGRWYLILIFIWRLKGYANPNIYPMIFFFCSFCFLWRFEAFSPQLVESNMPLYPSTRDRISLSSHKHRPVFCCCRFWHKGNHSLDPKRGVSPTETYKQCSQCSQCASGYWHNITATHFVCWG